MKKITIAAFSVIAFANLIGCAGVETAPAPVTTNEQDSSQTEKQAVSGTNKKAADVSGFRGLPKDYQEMLGIPNQEVILPGAHVEKQQAPATSTTNKK